MVYITYNMTTPLEQNSGQDPAETVFGRVREALAEMDTRAVRKYYGRLTTALAGAGITQQSLAQMSDPTRPFKFIDAPNDEFIIAIGVDTINITKATPQNGGLSRESFEITADGNASYSVTNFSRIDAQRSIEEARYGRISPDEQEEPEIVVDRLRDLTDSLEKSLANPAYLPRNIKYQIAALYGRLIQHLTPKGIIRTGEQKESIDYNNVALPGLDKVTLNFIREEGINGLRLTQRRPDGIIKRLHLFETGNASVLVFQPNASNNPVWSGRIQILKDNDHSERDRSLYPYLTFLEFQRVATQIPSITS